MQKALSHWQVCCEVASMTHYPFIPEKIFVQEKAAHHPLTDAILRHFAGGHCTVITLKDPSLPHVAQVPLAELIPQSKKCLFLKLRKGKFIKPFCSGYRKDLSAEYYIHHAENCPCDCHYCYLQTYFESFVPTIYVNRNEMFEEIKNAARPPLGAACFHAGHTADSFLLDEATGLSSKLVAQFRRLPVAALEIRTKIGPPAGLPELPDSGNIIISWTLAPENHIRLFESNTPALSERLASAAGCAQKGYRIGIRLDPIVLYSNWQDDYNKLLRELHARGFGAQIESFVLGTFRYYGRMAEIIKRRFPESKLLLGEFVPCADGKYRYFKNKRIYAYETMIKTIRKFFPDSRIHLCMETAEVEKRFEAI